jgi:hypothetical protein
MAMLNSTGAVHLLLGSKISIKGRAPKYYIGQTCSYWLHAKVLYLHFRCRVEDNAPRKPGFCTARELLEI